MKPLRFADRHIVVTGAGTGIGRAIAHRLSAEGAALTLLARVSRNLGDAMSGLSTATLAPEDLLETRGW